MDVVGVVHSVFVAFQIRKSTILLSRIEQTVSDTFVPHILLIFKKNKLITNCVILDFQ